MTVSGVTVGGIAEFEPQRRPRIMGILNVTPDSFSDGGRYLHVDAAIAHAVALVRDGADLIDVGGESTRPGASRVPVVEEQRRMLPVISGLVDRGIVVSVDTMNAATAEEAAALGASVINDVSGGLVDDAMASVVAASGLYFVANHWRGSSATAAPGSGYADVVSDVARELGDRVALLLAAGVSPSRVILDPGLGFAKSGADNWRLLSHLAVLSDIGFPVLIGASRKKFLAPFGAPDAPTAARDPATAIISALCAHSGVWGVRVHDVASTRTALEIWEAMQP